MSEPNPFRFTTNSLHRHLVLEYGDMNRALEEVGVNVRFGPPIRNNEFWLPGPNTPDINYRKQEYIGIYVQERTGLETGMEVNEAIGRYYAAFGLPTPVRDGDS